MWVSLEMVGAELVLISILGFPHHEGPQPLQPSKECEVEFDILIPKNINECPYYFVTSVGVHSHHPAPPTKAPKEIMDQVRDIIVNLRNPDLNLSEYLQACIGPTRHGTSSNISYSHLFADAPS